MPRRCCPLIVSVGGEKEASATLGGSKVDVEEPISKYSGRVGGREVYSLKVEGNGRGLPLELRGSGFTSGQFARGCT